LGEAVEIAAYNPNTMGQHVRRLVQIYQVEPSIRDEVQAIAAGHIGETIEPVKDKDSRNKQEENPELKNEISFRNSSTSEVANKLLPNNDQLSQSIDSFAMPQSSGNMFANQSQDPMLMQSPTILPDERDREIAMRQQAGIAGLV